MIPFLPELPPVTPAITASVLGPVTPGASAPGAFGLPGAALGGSAGREAGTSRDFAGLLNAALPEGEIAAPGLTNLPAPVSLPPAAATAVATPSAPTAAPVLLRELPAPPAIRLPTGNILPESGDALPPAAQSGTVLPVAPEFVGAPVAPETAAPAIAVQLRADASGGSLAHSDSPIITDGEEGDEALPGLPAPAPDAVPIAPPVILAAAPPLPAPTPARAAIRSDEPRAAPIVRAERTPLPARIALPEPESDAGSTLTPSVTPTDPQPAATTTSALQPAPTTPALGPQPSAAPAMVERVEPRATAADQESAIAAVGEIREALRAARPAMTLRHAEFGAVSLRIEPSGTQDWRAVLASRDPGFVPAIQAALAEQTVAAAADTAGAGNNPGQNGTSDQRYGASPNGGQGSSQPYSGHSSGRDEGGSAHSHHRQQSTTEAVASRAGEGRAEQPDTQTRGVFA